MTKRFVVVPTDENWPMRDPRRLLGDFAERDAAEMFRAANYPNAKIIDILSPPKPGEHSR